MPNADGTPTLSEKLLATVEGCPTAAGRDAHREAARIIAAHEQPGPAVAELRRRAAYLELKSSEDYHGWTLRWAADLRAHAATLAALKEAEARADQLEAALDAVRGLPEKWRGYPDLPFVIVDRFARELETAIASTGPGLRERVEAAIADLRQGAQSLGDASAGEAPTVAAIEACCDRIDAALRGQPSASGEEGGPEA